MASPGSPIVPKKGTVPAGSPDTAVDVQNSQTTVDYSTPTGITHHAELGDKMLERGDAANFSGMSSDVGLKNVNGNIVATQVGSNQALGVVGDVESGDIPASAVYQPHDDNTAAYKVRLTSQVDGQTIMFEVMPEIGESRSADYDDFTPIQHPGSILKYKGTSTREWSVTVRLASRTASEATENLRKINLLRSWVMPYYGQGTADDPETSQFLGAPPPVLTLSAYGKRMIGPTKVVLTSYQWNWPNDIDYIQTTTSPPVPFPVLVQLQLTLREAFSPREYSAFNLKAFRRGEMEAAFTSSSSSPQNSKPANGKTTGDATKINTAEATNATQDAKNAASTVANTRAAGNVTAQGAALVQQGSAKLSSINQNPGGGS